MGGLILLVLVLSNIFNKTQNLPKDLQEVEQQNDDEEGSVPVQNDSELSLLEAHLNSISEEITNIKTKMEKLDKLDKLEKLDKIEKQVSTPQKAELNFDPEYFKEQLAKLNAKMDAIYHVLSSIGKE
ncbi:MAG: hypothetical protein A2252_10755 [Elusimicrobia bacterium RIFOXYA2_FULL_39_19]|nr:MAG: hypothetical protein A2252_10755 [Elusimicrobia bacterium RIFOXYA2_FULL_39_19]